ncbi:MAG: PKD domain-containing protein, partial [bacterium]
MEKKKYVNPHSNLFQFLFFVVVPILISISCFGCGGGGGGNNAPIADARISKPRDLREIISGTEIRLDGSGSSDPDGDSIAYMWSIIEKPTTSSVVLSDSSAVMPSFVADLKGDYVIRLIVHDGKDNSTPDEIVVTVNNQTPVADAGYDQDNKNIGTVITLDGSGSFDPDNDPLTYNWSFSQKPFNSNASLSDPTIPNPTFTVDAEGTYKINLIVHDGAVVSAPDTVIVKTVNVNRVPEANAGPDQKDIIPGSIVTLDGSESSDPDGDTLTYSWTMTKKPSLSNASLTGANGSSPSFTADVKGDYEITLTVNDGIDESPSDSVIITAINRAPVCSAESDKNDIPPGTLITLDGSETYDLDNDPLTYTWSFISKPAYSNASLSDPSSNKPTFIPDIKGSYEIHLNVSDGEAECSLNITVIAINRSPLCDAGPDQDNIIPESVVALDASLSHDPDGDQLTYTWSFNEKPVNSNTSLSNTSAVNPTFIADVKGTYILLLTVSDGEKNCSNEVTVTAINRSPVCDAGPDQDNIIPESTVALDASLSYDPDGDPITYTWSFSEKPADSTTSLSDPSLVKPTFIADIKGTYRLLLTLSDGEKDCSDEVTVTATNRPPVCDAGEDQEIFTNETVILNGNGSSDPDGDSLNCEWTILEKPLNSMAELSNPLSCNPTFMADINGAYTIQLKVSDGEDDCTDDVILTTINQSPGADAGKDQGVIAGSLVTLDGSASNDPDQDTLSYQWLILTMPDESSAALSDPAIINPTFTADTKGKYELHLIVNDGTVDSEPDLLTIIAYNRKPIANAGQNQPADVDTEVALDGSESADPDGDSLSYSWSVYQRPFLSTATLSDSTVVNPTFTPDEPGAYIMQLIVNDAEMDSEPDFMTIVAGSPPLFANAGLDQDVKPGSLVTLDGSCSTGINLIYSWNFDYLPDSSSAVLDNPTTESPSFTADVEGDYVIILTVTDENGIDATDEVSVTAKNHKPIALTDVICGSPYTLDGSKSFDPDGDTLTYTWEFISRPEGSAAELSDPAAVDPTFIQDIEGTYELSLIVNDGIEDSDPLIVTITEDTCKPVADAGDDQMDIEIGALVELDGSGSYDPAGNPLTYEWSFGNKPDESTAEFDDPHSMKPKFTADINGTYEISLVVNNGTDDSAPDTVIVKTRQEVINPPIADAGPDQEAICLNTKVTLDGSGSHDPDGDALTYEWSFKSKPDDSGATLENSTSVNPSFTTDIEGTYELELIVSDGVLDSDPDSVTITAGNCKPVANAGEDQEVDVNTVFTLDGSGSYDPDGDALTYNWTIKEKPDGSEVELDDKNVVNPKFTPDLAGEYIIELIVNDGAQDSDPDLVTVIAGNRPPIANAGPDQIKVDPDTEVCLNGSSSYDPEGKTITFQWSFKRKPNGSNAEFDDSTSMSPCFTPDIVGIYEIELIVNDGEVNSAPDTVIISVGNRAPVANAGIDQNNIESGDNIILDGSNSYDPDGDAITYHWEIAEKPAGSNAELDDPTSMNPRFTVDIMGVYRLSLVVNDGIEDSVADSVLIGRVVVEIYSYDFEAGMGEDWWSDNGIWEVGEPTSGPGAAHSPSNCAATVLDGNYPKDPDSRLISPKIDLLDITEDQEIILRFQQYYSYSYQSNDDDKGRVQIQIYENGEWSDWTTLKTMSLYSNIWHHAHVDLTDYAGKRIRIAFYHQDYNGYYSGQSWGWYIDDVEIFKQTIPTFSVPGIDDFESGWGGWYSNNGIWEIGVPTVGPESAYSGLNCAATILDGKYPKDPDSYLISPRIDLPNVVDDEEILLRFQQYFSYSYQSNDNDKGEVRVSVYENDEWSSWITIDTVTGYIDEW